METVFKISIGFRLQTGCITCPLTLPTFQLNPLILVAVFQYTRQPALKTGNANLRRHSASTLLMDLDLSNPNH